MADHFGDALGNQDRVEVLARLSQMVLAVEEIGDGVAAQVGQDEEFCVVAGKNALDGLERCWR
jgi:hypothetical protein